MNNECKYCKKELPLTGNKLGIQISLKKYCDNCAPIRTKIINRLREDKDKLKNHYLHLKTELEVIDQLKELIKLGEDSDKRILETLQTGKYYWSNYNLKEFYEPNKQKAKDDAELKQQILNKEDI